MNFTFLIIDDSFLVRANARMVFEDYGITLFEASNFDEALKICSQHPITDIIADINIPGSLGGADLIRAIFDRSSLNREKVRAILATTGRMARLEEGFQVLEKERLRVELERYFLELGIITEDEL